MIQIRGYGYKRHESIHLGPEQLLHPEPIKPLPEDLDWSRGGVEAFVPLAAEAKKVVSIPVMVVGRLNHEIGKLILSRGEANIIAMNRQLLADPELPLKVASGRLDEIAPCTGCLHCWSRRRQNRTIEC